MNITYAYQKGNDILLIKATSKRSHFTVVYGRFTFGVSQYGGSQEIEGEGRDLMKETIKYN